MLKIHILDVHHGDSIAIESRDGDSTYWSLIDCHNVKDQTPTIDLLIKNEVMSIHAICISHLDQDHISGIRNLIDYLLSSGTTVEYVFSPVLPEETETRAKFFKRLFPGSSKRGKKAISVLLDLGLLRNADGNPVSIERGHYIGDFYESWTSAIHPGVDMAFLNPNHHQLTEYISSLLSDTNPDYSRVNDLSQVILLRPHGSKDTYLFPGDLDSERLRNVCNIAAKISEFPLKEHLRFIKAPHHGTFTPAVEKALNDMLCESDRSFLCVSCRSEDAKHPSPHLIKHVVSNFPNCQLACTGLSPNCSELQREASPIPHFLGKPKQHEFESFLKQKNRRTKFSHYTPCHGNIIVERTLKGDFSLFSETKNVCIHSK